MSVSFVDRRPEATYTRHTGSALGPSVPFVSICPEGTDVTVTEQARHRLHAHLEETMGEEHAAALMEWLPDGPIAGKDDVERLRVALKTDIEHLREVMDFRWEHTATKADLIAVREELGVGLANLRTEMHKGFTRQTWALITAMGVLNGLLLAA